MRVGSPWFSSSSRGGRHLYPGDRALLPKSRGLERAARGCETYRAVNEPFDVSGGAPVRAPQIAALREAYRDGRLVVSADPGALARTRLENGHAIDARDVADAVLREISADAFRRRRRG